MILHIVTILATTYESGSRNSLSCVSRYAESIKARPMGHRKGEGW